MLAKWVNIGEYLEIGDRVLLFHSIPQRGVAKFVLDDGEEIFVSQSMKIEILPGVIISTNNGGIRSHRMRLCIGAPLEIRIRSLGYDQGKHDSSETGEGAGDAR